jgi:hypothetical protein
VGVGSIEQVAADMKTINSIATQLRIKDFHPFLILYTLLLSPSI